MAVVAFAPSFLQRTADFRLFMGKGFNKGRNKQAELAKKMQLAKKQRDPGKANVEDVAPVQKDEKEIKLEEDRLLFAQLLVDHQPVVVQEQSEVKPFTQQTESKSEAESKSRGPKVRAKDLKKRKKASKKREGESLEEEDTVTLQEGDVAKRRHFEHLVSLETSQPLGAIGAAQLVPWVPPYLSKYLVVLVDPRKQSGDLRQAIQYLTSNVDTEILENTICVNADSKDETKSWMKRANIDTPIQMFSDQKLEWMRTYSAVADDDRWSMSVFLFCTSGVIQKHLRQVDPSKASQLVTDVVQSIKEE